MSERIVREVERRYNVEVGEQHYTLGYYAEDEPKRGRIDWRFIRAFTRYEDAQAYAERISEDHEFVRIIDKGEA